jgi:hypothetical protein
VDKQDVFRYKISIYSHRYNHNPERLFNIYNLYINKLM